MILNNYKKGDRSVPANYRPISLTSVCCKVMEHIIFHACMSYQEYIIETKLMILDLYLDTHVPPN